jgi:hypothetical protein
VALCVVGRGRGVRGRRFRAQNDGVADHRARFLARVLEVLQILRLEDGQVRGFGGGGQDLVHELEGVALADVPGYDGAGREDEHVAPLGVFYFGRAVGDLHVDDLWVQAGIVRVDFVALGFDEVGGGGDVVSLGGAVCGDCLLDILVWVLVEHRGSPCVPLYPRLGR